jgi:hypothetical protein
VSFCGYDNTDFLSTRANYTKFRWDDLEGSELSDYNNNMLMHISECGRLMLSKYHEPFHLALAK